MSTRRTDAFRLRQTISALLEQIDVIERSMEMFHRKGDHAERNRAAESYEAMLVHVDRLGELLWATRREKTERAAEEVA